MGFDLARAITDSLSGHASVVDRLVTYLYFSEIAVLEQSTWDEYGSGVSVIGTKGERTGPSVVLATPLPSKRILNEKDPESPLDVVCLCDLMAKTWALSEVTPTKKTVHLVAYRPDALGVTLREILGAIGEVSHVIIYGPVGPCPIPCWGRLALFRLDRQCPRKLRLPKPQAMLRFVSSNRIDPRPFMKALLQVATVLQKDPKLGAIRPFWGFSLMPPCELAFFISSSEISLSGWVSDKAYSPVDLIDASSFTSIMREIQRIAREVLALWGAKAPKDACSVLAMYNQHSYTTAYVAATFPPSVSDDQMQSIIKNDKHRKSTVTTELIHMGTTGTGNQVTSISACASALSLVTNGARLVMGPTTAEAIADPVAVTKSYAKCYRDLLTRLL